MSTSGKTIEVRREAVVGPVMLIAGDVEEVGVFDSLADAERGAEAYMRRVFKERGCADPTRGKPLDLQWLTNDSGVLYGYLRGIVSVFMRHGQSLPEPTFYAQPLSR